MSDTTQPLSLGDRVSSVFEEGVFVGKIEKLLGRRSRVRFDDGEVLVLDNSTLTRLDDDDSVDDADDLDDVEVGDVRSIEDEFPQGGGKGFNLYPVTWNGTNFGVDMEDGSRFYGCWRKTVFGNSSKTFKEGYAIDIWAKYKGHEYSVESIPYTNDPRSDPKSLASDICAAISKFMYRVENKFDTLEEVRKKAARPRIRISRLETLDLLIFRLTEIRDTAIRAGGQRLCAIEGDYEGDPIVGLSIDVTQQAMLLINKDGKGMREPPSIRSGRSAILDDPSRGRATTFKADPAHIRALVEKLRTTENKAEARKIRQILRKCGHRGGARSIKPEPELEPAGTMDTDS